MKQTTIDIAIALLILLFLYTAGYKLVLFHQFELQLKSSPLTASHAVLFAIIIPSLEIITVIVLLVRKSIFAGLVLSALLMFAFTGYVTYMLLFVKHLPCSCGGVIAKMSWKQHLMFNIFFTILSLIALKFFITINRFQAESPVKNK